MRQEFASSPINLKRESDYLRSKKSIFLVHEGRKKALQLFHRASKFVPAYKDFLKKEKVSVEKVKTWEDFQYIPFIDKSNYLQKYPFNNLHWNGSLRVPLIYTSTSGSTGKPVYFSRQRQLDWQYATILEEFLQNGSQGKKHTTLVIICFAMGVWIGGLITYQAYEIASNNLQSPISIITPGINKSEIIKTLMNIAPNYNQVILVGYPPFIKDVIDEAISEKIPVKKMNFRFHFAAEAITEGFRDYLIQSVGIKNPFRDFINIYGSADVGAMAYEGAASILVRRLAAKNKNLFSSLFSDISKTPTLAQYNPRHIQFESVQGKILLSANNSIPLVRYAIGDHGGAFSFDDQEQKLINNNFSFWREARRNGIENFITQFPFVYVYERSDFSATLYGINIFPEMIREGLQQKVASRSLSGRFLMMTKFDGRQNQFLEINLELKKDGRITSPLSKIIERNIKVQLQKRSSEFRELINELKDRKLIKLKFWAQGYKKFFAPNIKQRWVLNDKKIA